jgi:hypothetical protein
MIEMRWRISAARAGLSGMPSTTAFPDVGASSVPRIRTVVVLPAPFGPRNPNTSPRVTLNDTSATAVRPPNVLVRWLTSTAAGFRESRAADALIATSFVRMARLCHQARPLPSRLGFVIKLGPCHRARRQMTVPPAWPDLF